ncbi:MAG: pilus assembly protein PilM [bacterium]|nr:pilus assembly protein PilM [bacterium]
MANNSLTRFANSGLLALHFTPEELFVGFGQRKGRSHRVRGLDVIDLRPHIIEGNEYNHSSLVPALGNVMRKNGIRTKRTVISFPVKFPWIRVLEVPTVPEREMGRIVRLEVERLYLDSTVEKLIDWFPLGTESNDPASAGSTRVLSVAIPRNTIAPYVDLMFASKLDIVGIDLAEVSVLKLAALQGVNFDDGITLVLNFNMQSTDLMLMENDRLQLVRKVGQGKQQLREILSRALHDDPALLTEMENVDFVLPLEHMRLASDYVANLLGEIRRSIEFYLTELKRAEGNVSKVVIAGSGYWPANLSQMLGQQLQLPLIDLQFDMMPQVYCESEFKEAFPAASIYAPVVGSVLRGVA